MIFTLKYMKGRNQLQRSDVGLALKNHWHNEGLEGREGVSCFTEHVGSNGASDTKDFERRLNGL